jgi:hypothetical protein
LQNTHTKEDHVSDNQTNEDQPTGQTPAERAPYVPGSNLTPAARRAGARRGGSRPKPSTPLTGLNLDTAPAIDIATAAGRLSLLAGAAEAVVLGRCSSATATALVSIVRAASEVVAGDQADQIEVLSAKVDELLAEVR